MKKIRIGKVLLSFIALGVFVFFFACNDSEESETPEEETCSNEYPTDTSRGECSETLAFNPSVNIDDGVNNKTITTNNIPNHKVGKFGKISGAINPNAIKEVNSTHAITKNPSKASTLTPLQDGGPPQYSFGILLNGVELDPIAAEPFPHEGAMSSSANWDWNLEAINVKIGLDCNNAHVQPTGKYHYHGTPTLYLENLSISADAMTLVGYAADGFPIYYKYAYEDASDPNSAVIVMKSGYKLKTGERSGDGVSAPCGTYNGAYSADYEYSADTGVLDEANGREGVTPEFPNGTYYYMITDEFPAIPRYFRGTPSNSFKLGPG